MGGFEIIGYIIGWIIKRLMPKSYDKMRVKLQPKYDAMVGKHIAEKMMVIMVKRERERARNMGLSWREYKKRLGENKAQSGEYAFDDVFKEVG